MRVDVHQHLWPPEFIAALRAREAPPLLDGWRLRLAGEPEYEVDPRDHDPGRRAALLAADGVDRALISLSSPLGIEHLPPDEARPLLDAYHTGAARLPAAFSAWAAACVTAPDPDALAAALDAGFVGLQLPATALSDAAGYAHCAPLLDVLTAHNKPLLIHPGPAWPGAVHTEALSYAFTRHPTSIPHLASPAAGLATVRPVAPGAPAVLPGAVHPGLDQSAPTSDSAPTPAAAPAAARSGAAYSAASDSASAGPAQTGPGAAHFAASDSTGAASEQAGPASARAGTASSRGGISSARAGDASAVVDATPSWWAAMVPYVAQMHTAWFAFRTHGRHAHTGLRVCFCMLAGLAPLHHERAAARGGPAAAGDPDVWVETSSYGPEAIAAVAGVLGRGAIVGGSDFPYATLPTWDVDEHATPRLLG